MPFIRPTLTELRNQVTQDIASGFPGADPLLRFSNLNIAGVAQANLANLHYGYIDWIAKQAVPFTATDEYLEGWAALKGIYRQAATSASGTVTFKGTPGRVIPQGAGLMRGDGIPYSTSAAVLVGAGGKADVQAVADPDLTGQTGAFGNAVVGTSMTLAQAIEGVQASGIVSAAFTGGSDIESNDSLRSRMLLRYQTPPRGGARDDYVTWAKEVPGVTRAWSVANVLGIGSVVVYIMLDRSQAAHGGFPQGINGAATEEPRGMPATGDQLRVADHILPLQPVTAFVNVAGPVANPVNFMIQNLPVAARPMVAGAIADVFLRDGAPGKSVPLAHIWSAISSISGVDSFVILAPLGTITNPLGALPVVGTITYIQTI
ncbi:baseplate J/gp47 family protein [Janthinobacterium sp. MDB2-8]|uniref:baseplate J/gp47 family protein n=1 Tax=Janthinobacterium sp. MDB2-8 TaxID=1259338 RepID=UPI003F25AEFE